MDKLEKTKLRYKLQECFDNVETVENRYSDDVWFDAMDMLTDDVEEIIEQREILARVAVAEKCLPILRDYLPEIEGPFSLRSLIDDLQEITEANQESEVQP